MILKLFLVFLVLCVILDDSLVAGRKRVSKYKQKQRQLSSSSSSSEELSRYGQTQRRRGEYSEHRRRGEYREQSKRGGKREKQRRKEKYLEKLRRQEKYKEQLRREEDDDEEQGQGSESGSAEDATPKRVVIAKCGGTYDLEKTLGLKLDGSGKFCNWTILGSPTCQPELTCSTIKVKGKDCDETYFEVADGVGAFHRSCGNTKLSKKGIKASKGARDLFVTLKGHSGAQVKCESHCSNGKSKPDLLTNMRKKKYDDRCVCGVQNKDDRIVNGEDAKRNEFPWQAAIVNKGTRSPTCGASLINDRWILTATHCFWFSNTTADQIDVLLHAHLLDFTLGADWKDVELGQQGSIRGSGWDKAKVSDEEEGTVRLEVAEIIMHPLFTEGYDYDVALLRLAKTVDLSTIEATPICLTPPGDRKEYVDETATVSGWGMPAETGGSTTRLLQKLNVPILDTQKCADMMKFPLTPRMLCAGFQKGGQDACTGDSGGPLVVKQNKDQFAQVGVVSWGEGCARADRPGIYSRMTDMNEWVQYHTMKSNPIWCRETTDAADAGEDKE